jgi:HisJ family histidinol phosphate phosphatase
MIKMDMHLHSNFSDGKNTVEEMTEMAVKLGYKQIAFTDHVWRITDWLDEYVAEIDRVKNKYHSVRIFSGIEAKVLDIHGNIDARDDFLEKVNFVLAAFHKIPNGAGDYLSQKEIFANKKQALDLWYQSFMNVLENNDVHIIAHPTAILKEFGINLPLEMKTEITRKAKIYEKTFELNIKHRVPDAHFIKILRNEGIHFSFGSDSHSTKELEEATIKALWVQEY